jgi:hypothetical protein
MSRDGYVICVYTHNGTRDDIEDLMRARAALRSQGFAEELGYQRDIETWSGKYGLGEWHLRA